MTEQLFTSVEATFANCLATMHRKNADYSEVGDPYKNFRVAEMLGVAPERGILIRLSDKMMRINNLIGRAPQVTEESLDDSIEDAINYLALLKAMRAAQTIQPNIPAMLEQPDYANEVLTDDYTPTYITPVSVTIPTADTDNIIKRNVAKIWDAINISPRVQ